MSQSSRYFIYILLITIIISSCQHPARLSNLSHPEIKLAENSGFKTSIIKTNDFELTSLIKKNNVSSNVKNLVIYIEGDGRSWIKKHLLSKDPTPPYALGLRLAIQDPRGFDQNTVVAYLARPCQFTQQKPTPNTCDAKYWSSDRFSELVIQNINQAIDKIKENTGFTEKDKLELIGYSGGAAIVVLLAARRNDVAIIRTVAGDLNHDLMSEYHHTTPLSNSLNPIDIADKIKNIKQVHYIGNKDKIVPKIVTENFVATCKKSLIKKPLTPIIVSINATHQKGWEASWSQLLSDSPI